MATDPKRRTLTVRLSDEELAMLDRTCEYVRRSGRTVLGEQHITHADALKRLAAVGYKKVEAALRREAAEAGTGTQPTPRPSGDPLRAPEAPGAGAAPGPALHPDDRIE